MPAMNSLPSVTGLPAASGMETASGTASGLAVLLVVMGLRGYLRLRATTLAAPSLWATLSAGCLAVGGLVEAQFEGVGLSALRFAIAATTLCPLVAVLGAKRPQNRGWQWVVLALWVVLVWPAVQAVLLPTGARLELFVAWKLFLWCLIGVGLLNYLPTRHWLAALLAAAGQMLLLREHLGLENLLAIRWASTIGMSCFLLAALLVSCRGQRRASAESRSCLAPFDARWRNFRDAYGAFWALRMLGRINQAAEFRDWPQRLSWGGFVTGDRQPTVAQLGELEQALWAFLRRFLAESSC